MYYDNCLCLERKKETWLKAKEEFEKRAVLLTTNDIGKIFNVHNKTVREWVERFDLPISDLYNNQIKATKDDVERWLPILKEAKNNGQLRTNVEHRLLLLTEGRKVAKAGEKWMEYRRSRQWPR